MLDSPSGSSNVPGVKVWREQTLQRAGELPGGAAREPDVDPIHERCPLSSFALPHAGRGCLEANGEMVQPALLQRSAHAAWG